MTVVRKRSKPRTRTFEVTLRWIASGLPDSRRYRVNGPDISVAMDKADDFDNIPDDLDVATVTSLTIQVKEVAA